MSGKSHGQCLCGKVTFSTPAVSEVGICHCEMCRRWSGGPSIAAHFKSKPEIEGEEFIAWYSSSDWAERGFCSQCGSNLFYRLKGGAPDFVVCAGAYDDQSGFKVTAQIFIEEKPDYYDFAGDIPSMTGEEVFAMYAAGNEADNGESQS